LPLISFGDT